jgi:hypothetical protein
MTIPGGFPPASSPSLKTAISCSASSRISEWMAASCCATVPRFTESSAMNSSIRRAALEQCRSVPSRSSVSIVCCSVSR